MYKIVVTDDRYGSYEEEMQVLEAIGARVEVHDFLHEDDAIPVLFDADGVLVNLFPLTRRVIETMDKCRIISRYGVGYDNVDVQAAEEKNIWVARVPDYCTEDVSDHAVALLLGCTRSIPFKDRRVREGGWNLQEERPSFRIRGKTVGIIGFGRSGRAFHRKLSGFGAARFLVYDPSVPPGDVSEADVAGVDLRTLLQAADFISLHVPLTAQTTSLIGGPELALMKKQAILINTSRGGVIDEDALISALQENRIGGAGLDVYREEPLPPFSPLVKMDSVILTDHTGWYSDESVQELKRKAAENVRAALIEGKPVYPVRAEQTQER